MGGEGTDLRTKLEVGLCIALILSTSFIIVKALTPLTKQPYYLTVLSPSADYIVASWTNGTYYDINGTNWNVDTIGSTESTVVQVCINALPSGGSIYLFDVAMPSDITYGSNVVIIQDYQGVRNYYSNNAMIGTETSLGRSVSNLYGASWVNSTMMNANSYYLSATQLDPSTADFVVEMNGSICQAWYGANNTLAYSSTNASYVLDNTIAQGNSVFVGSGTYTVSSGYKISGETFCCGLLINHTVDLWGEGDSTVFYLGQTNSRVISIYNANSVHLHNFKVDGANLNANPNAADGLIVFDNGANNGKVDWLTIIDGNASDAIGTYNVAGAAFSHLFMQYCTHGVVFTESSRCIADSSIATNMHGTGFSIQGGVDAGAYDDKFEHDWAYSCVQNGFEIIKATNVAQRDTVSTCSGFLNGWSGLSLYCAGSCEVSNNHFFNNNGSGIQMSDDGITASGYDTIANNHLFDDRGGNATQQYGLDILNSTFSANIHDNNIWGNVNASVRYGAGAGANKWWNNIGFVTQNSISGANTTATTAIIYHGLSGVATYAWCSFSTTAITGYMWTSDSSAITITVTGDSLPSSWTVYANVQYQP